MCSVVSLLCAGNALYYALGMFRLGGGQGVIRVLVRRWLGGWLGGDKRVIKE